MNGRRMALALALALMSMVTTGCGPFGNPGQNPAAPGGTPAGALTPGGAAGTPGGLAGTPGLGGTTPGAAAPANGRTAAETAIDQAMLAQLNQLRAQNGAPALQFNASLLQASYGHAVDMCERNYFDHATLGGGSPSSRAQRAGYTGGVAENIAMMGGSQPGGEAEVARQLLAIYMDSPGHRSNMLNARHTVCGLGTSTRRGVRNCQVFGSR